MPFPIYTISTETLGSIADQKLHRQIVQAGPYSTAFQGVFTERDQDRVTVLFAAPPTAPEQATITAVLAAHGNPDDDGFRTVAGSELLVGSDRFIGVVVLGAPIVLTMPPVTDRPAFLPPLIVKDETGLASGILTITIAADPADTIDGAATAVIATAFGALTFVPDGVNLWSIV